MDVTCLGCAIVHQLVASFLLMDPEVNLVGHIARGIDHLSPEPSRSPHTRFCFSFPPRHSGEAYTDSKIGV
jgi:hypothetical protein